MKIILILLGIFWILAGILLYIFTDSFKEVMRKILRKKNLKVISPLPISAGLALILGSSLVRMPWIAITLGILGLLKGLSFLLLSQKKNKALLDWWLGASDGVCKAWGIVTFLTGVLLLVIL